MTKNLKRKMIATLCMAFAAVSCFSVANLMTASAATTGNSATEQQFWMTDGAAVRVKAGESGIRWETNVEESWYESLSTSGATVEFHTLVTAADNIDDITELTYDDAADKTKEVKDLKADVTSVTFNQYDTNDDGEITADDASLFKFYGSIIYDKLTTEYQIKAYAAELIARSYISITAGEGDSANTQIIYATAEDTARSIRAVANACVEDTEAFAKFDEETEQPIIKGYLGTKGTDVTYSGKYFEKAVGTGTLAENTYNVAYAGSKKVGTVNGTTLTLTEELELGETYNLTLFDDDGNYAKTSDIFYITKTLGNSDFAVLKTADANENYYVLKEDITLSGTWTSELEFTGTFDGNEHSITGLTPEYSSGIFKTLNNATVKNVAIHNVVLGDQIGAIADKVVGKAVVDNVYVSVQNTRFHEDSNTYAGVTMPEDYTSYVGLNQRYKGGMFHVISGDIDVTVSNSVVYMPEFLSNNHGFIAGRSGVTAKINDCTFIGGNGKIFGTCTGYNGKPTTNDGTVITDAVKAHQTYKANWSEFIGKAYDTDHPFVQITAANFEEKMLNLTTEIVLLTEDYAATDTWNATSKGNFAGVFDGGNHKITGLAPTMDDYGGIFKRLEGSVKNVAVYGTLTVNTGLICDLIGYSQIHSGNGTAAYLENIYVEKSGTSYSQAGPIAKQMNSMGGVSMKNVVTNIVGGSSSTPGFIGYIPETKTHTAIAEDCYAIMQPSASTPSKGSLIWMDGNGNVSGNSYYFLGAKAYTMSSDKTVMARAAFDADYTAGNVTLTDFLKGILYPSAQ